MGKIRLLPDALASQVAAGEVVERPASVVKELVENSIDAGAKNIEILVQRGGIALIRITDDGHGMNRDDALMCLERHATSKIRTKDDLEAISTLGFRGEALPSIASVSKFRLTTREPEALSGTEIVVNGGKIASVKDCGEPPGTQIEVRSLFFNIPARRKFLRTENTEFSHLEQVVRTQAIAHPEIRFALVRNERIVFQLPATTDIRERIAGLAGHDLASRLLEIKKQTHHGVTVSGYIGPPGMGQSDRRKQLIFLNGRPVEAAMLSYALREGYHTALMKGQYPVTFLFLETDPSAVDVNVHPAKREVRFHDGNSVRDAVIAAIQETLTGAMKRPVAGVGLTGMEKPEAPLPADAKQADLIAPAEAHSLRNDWSGFSPQRTDPVGSTNQPSSIETAERTNPVDSENEPSSFETEQPPMRAEDYRLMGVLGKLYVLLEHNEGLVLMDQHAAHERVLFEEMRRRMESEGVPSQGLLTPLMVELAPKDFDLVSQNVETLGKLGIAAEPFGGNTLKIDSLPTFLKSDDPEAFLQDVIDEIRNDSDRMSKMRLGEDMVATTVCRHAVKANDPLHDAELVKLLADLLECEMPYCCPHGRPTLIQISYGELDKKFGRKV
ncbi:MAG: DNA mismatch repair endonuclease MutL [Verrucomicrobiales bacterium]|nr:DNA mismatch repair endonuclease MutL [Verrucomicrobiales bacterium]